MSDHSAQATFEDNDRVASAEEQVNASFWHHGAEIGLILAAMPVILIASALIMAGIKLSSPGPVILKLRCLGRHGRQFSQYRFRIVRSDSHLVAVTSQTHAYDPRLTKIGRVLLETGLNKLPQIINILQGDMALFGPRAIPLAQASQTVLFQQYRNATRPGLVSW